MGSPLCFSTDGMESKSNSYLRREKREKAVKKQSAQKKQSAGSKRSAMLKLVMPHLSSREGEELQEAIADGDGAKAEQALQSIGALIRKELESD